jgi:L-fuculokinase
LKQPVILIFDIGKTAKKALVFDSNFHVLEEAVEHFTEITDEDGFPSEDLAHISRWIKEKAKFFFQHPSYHVTAINFSAYGASLVHLDKMHTPIYPFYNYLKPFPDDCKAEFCEHYNPAGDLPAITSSPWLGMLNSGLQLYWIKKTNPEKFKRIHTVLHFPQYFPFLISQKKFTDITSVGCHTMLWDFPKNTYHNWVTEENLIPLFPAVTPSSHSVDTALFSIPIKLGIGVHDSSAALMPFLVSMNEPFMLLSTGTWNIAFNPFNNSPLSLLELKKDCLCYLSFEGKPVKASRIFLGHEHELQVKAIANHFDLHAEEISAIKFEHALFVKAVSDKDTQKTIYPLGMDGAGPFPEKVTKKTLWNNFPSAEEAYHYTVLQLARWQKVSLDLVDPERKIKTLIVVGGFTKNQLFLEALKHEVDHLKLFLSDHPRAAALGAAWLVAGVETRRGKKDILQVTPF